MYWVWNELCRTCTQWNTNRSTWIYDVRQIDSHIATHHAKFPATSWHLPQLLRQFCRVFQAPSSAFAAHRSLQLRSLQNIDSFIYTILVGFGLRLLEVVWATRCKMVVVPSKNFSYVKYHCKPECVPKLHPWNINLKNMHLGKHKDYNGPLWSFSSVFYLFQLWNLLYSTKGHLLHKE